MASRQPWGTCQCDGKAVELLTLSGEAGGQLQVCTYGATLVSLTVPDRQGRLDDVLLGFDNLAAYEQHTTYVGCAVGRVCSRIAGARFQLGDEVHTLPQNNGTACHHGGPVGFNSYTWEVVEAAESCVKLRHVSNDGDQGFPGNLDVVAEYALLPTIDKSVALSVRFRAQTDKKTVVNLTNHLYFNLAGNHEPMPQTMYNHIVTLAADAFVPTNEINIPLGELRNVENTPFDFRTPTKIGARIEEEDEQLKIASGYDHNMALRDTGAKAGHGGTRLLGVEADAAGRWSRTRAPDATALDPSLGRSVELYTEEPAVHFYTGNYLGNDPMGKGGVPIARRAGFCFETQHFTDSPNQLAFPSVVLEPGQTWETHTVFWFPCPTDAAASA